MHAIVICPDRSSALPFFSRTAPVALTPALGPNLLSHALTALAIAGARRITILASDRPEEIRRAIGYGERWGVSARVVPEKRQLTIEEARAKYRPVDDWEWMPKDQDILVADGSGILAERSPLQKPADWFAALQKWLPDGHAHRLGVHEISPGVWVGLRARIENGAVLEGPCWIGEGAWIRAGSRVGPEAWIEDEVLIDHEAVVRESWVAPRTYVGALTHVEHSLAWGAGLLNYETDSYLEVPDAFLLSPLQRPKAPRSRSGLPGRILALALGVLTSPVVPLAWWRSRRKGVAFRATHRAILPQGAGTLDTIREIEYDEFPSFRGLWRRWPQLWSIVRGDFSWVGNRPITREQAAELTTEFEQLWLAAPVGLVSLADAEGCAEAFGDEARAHASFYAAQLGRKLDLQILRRLFQRNFQPAP
ncbi:MAG TPA: sugar transferase [Chthoniobacter sp.]|jgi:hypothetical protein